MKKLRILFISGYYKPYLGGIERSIEYLSKYMIERREMVERVGVMTTHFAFKRKYMEGLAEKEIMDNGVEVFRINSIPKKISLPYFSFPLNWFSIHEIKKVIDEFKPNIINWHGDGWFIGNNMAALLAPHGTGIIFNPHFHPQRFDMKLWLKPIDMEMYMRSDKVIHITEFEAKLVKKEFLVPKRKQVIIPWGIEPHELTIENIKRPFRILCVGRVGKAKNQKYLLEIWNKARSRFNKRTQLVFVGRDENKIQSADKLRKFVTKLGITENEVIFTGEVSDEELQGWYTHSDIFALFSHYEAFGLSYVEALSYGLAVLTHDIGPVKTILKKGTIFVEKNNREKAIRSLVKLVNDDAYRKALALEGKEYSKNFSWDYVVDNYLEVYSNVLTKKKSRHNLFSQKVAY